jgi:integrase
MTRVADLLSPRERVADVNGRLEANAVEIEAVIAGAEREHSLRHSFASMLERTRLACEAVAA